VVTHSFETHLSYHTSAVLLLITHGTTTTTTLTTRATPPPPKHTHTGPDAACGFVWSACRQPAAWCWCVEGAHTPGGTQQLRHKQVRVFGGGGGGVDNGVFVWERGNCVIVGGSERSNYAINRWGRLGGNAWGDEGVLQDVGEVRG